MQKSRRLAIGGALICLGAAGPVWADESLAHLLACRDVSDAKARLTCFDREAAALSSSSAAPSPAAPASITAAAPAGISTAAAGIRAAPAATPAASPVTATPAPALDPEQKFGLPEKAIVAKEVAAGTRPADASKIDAHITQLTQAANGRMVFTLDNDQVWRQLSAEGEMLAKQGDAVTISRGMLGSYWLQIKSGRGCKVTRVR